MGSFAARIGGVLAPYVLELQNYVVWLPNTIFGVLSKIVGVTLALLLNFHALVNKNFVALLPTLVLT